MPLAGLGMPEGLILCPDQLFWSWIPLTVSDLAVEKSELVSVGSIRRTSLIRYTHTSPGQRMMAVLSYGDLELPLCDRH
jgi:hypothetical protein